MRIQHLLMIAALTSIAGAPANAQTVKKVGAGVHHALKKTGNEVKEAAGEVGSATHRTLQKAGNDSKAELKRTTGVKPVGGDVGKAARHASRHGKKLGRTAKKGVKASASQSHRELRKTGTEAKAVVKPD